MTQRRCFSPKTQLLATIRVKFYSCDEFVVVLEDKTTVSCPPTLRGTRRRNRSADSSRAGKPKTSRHVFVLDSFPVGKQRLAENRHLLVEQTVALTTSETFALFK